MANSTIIVSILLACAFSFVAGALIDNAVNQTLNRLDAKIIDHQKKTIAAQMETIETMQRTANILQQTINMRKP